MPRHSERSRRQAHQSRYSVRQKHHRRILLLENLEPRMVLSSGLSGAVTDASPWQNPLGPSDLDGDGKVAPLDVLVAINELNRGVAGELAGKLAPPVLAGQVQGAVSSFFDANGDGQLTPGDVLQVVNAINHGQDAAPTTALPATDQQPDQIGADVPQLNFVHGFARANAALNTVGDVDVFSVVPTQNRLNVALFTLDNVEMNFKVVDASGNELATQSTTGSRLTFAAAVDLAVTAGDTYYIEVSGGSDVTGRYSLQVMNYGKGDYTPVAPAQFSLSLPASVQSGQPVAVRLTALNAQGRPVDYSGTANLSSSDAAATLPATVTFDDGRAAFQVTFGTEGQQTLTATDSKDPTLTAQATTTVGAPAAATQFVVKLPRDVPTGVAVTVQLAAVDASQHLAANYSGTVNVTSSDAGAMFPASVTFAKGYATFQVTFATIGAQTLNVADSTDAALTGRATTDVVAPAVAAQFAVRLPRAVPIGVAVTVELAAVDADENLVSSYSGTVQVTSSDATATLPASVTFTNGIASFQVTFATAGSQTLTVTDSAAAPLTGQATTDVVAPAVATQLVLRLPQGVQTGVVVTVQAVALDANDRLVSDYSGTVAVTSSDATAALPASVTFKNGYASFQVTFASAGAQTLTVTDTADATLTAAATTNVVAPAAATQLVVRLPQSVPTGVAVTVQLAAVDANEHLVADYAGTVSVASSDATATLPASVTFKNGYASLQITFATAGSQTLTVTDTADATLTGQATTNVAAPAAATQLVVLLPPNVTAGTAATVQLVALDVQRHVLPSYTGTVGVSSSDTRATLPASVTFKNGSATFQATFATAGSQTLTVTDSANASLTGQATTNVVAPAAATQLVVRLPQTVPTATAVTVQLAAVDARGRLVSSYSGAVTVASSDTKATLPTSVIFKNGYASFQVTFATAGAQTVTVTDSTDPTITGQATTSVVAPAVATQLTVQLPRSVKPGAAVTVQLVALDARGRLVSNYSGSVTIASSDTKATLPTSVIFKNGYASFQVTFATAGAQTVTVTDSTDPTITGQATTSVVAPAVATQLTVQLPRSVKSGAAVTVQLVALDARGRLVSNYSGSVTIASSDTKATLPTSVTFKNGYASFQATFATAGAQTVTATDSVNSSLTGQATTNVGSTTTTTGDFSITLNLTGMTASEQQIARDAAARWEAVIVGDLPNVNYHGTTIDDVLINIGLQTIDGSGGILGEGGPDAVRAGDGLPYLGTITIDTADASLLERQGELLDVLTHEIGHVLGLGTVWDSKGLVGGTSSNPVFVGAQATAAYNAVFGTHASGVPLENRGTSGDGTYGAHWRQSVFHNELMVGYIQSGGMPLSSITVASMADIGYQVNMAAADPYTPTGVASSIAAASASSVSSGATSLASSSTWLPTNSVGETLPEATGGEHHRRDPTADGGTASAGSTSTNQIAVGTRRHAWSATVDRVFQDTGWWFDA